jgi:hypothetical protein
VQTTGRVFCPNKNSTSGDHVTLRRISSPFNSTVGGDLDEYVIEDPTESKIPVVNGSSAVVPGSLVATS